MRIAALAACWLLATGLFAPSARACQPFGAADIDRLRATGLAVEVVEGDVAARVLADLRRRVAIVDDPTRLVIVFAEAARIGLVFGEEICAIVSGPTEETREMLRRARGEPS
jgi:hypothetical protein